MAVNPKPFAKLDIDPRVTGKILLTGARVIKTDSDLPSGVFEGVSKPGPGLGIVPLSTDQQDCRYDHGSEAPAAVVDGGGGNVAFTFQDQGFVNQGVKAAQIGVGPTSNAYRTAIRPVPGGTGQLTRFLLTPAERREIQHAEQQTHAAQGTAKRAEMQRRRLAQTLRDRYPHGAAQVDGVENSESEESVYADRAALRMAEAERRVAHEAGRRHRLNDISMQEPRFGHQPFNHNEEFLGRKETKFMQEKAPRPCPYDDTHDRLFGSQSRKHNAARTQELRNRDIGGKPYDLISQTEVTQWPSNIRDRSRRHDYSFMAHPSQQSLELQRSLQGEVKPGDRSTGMIIFG